MTQTGYKFLDGNKVQIGKQVYKYSKSRELCGEVKTVTIKRDALGDLYIIVVCGKEQNLKITPRTGSVVGYDFGLQTFLKASDGRDILSPEFFKNSQNKIKSLNRSLSRKKKGSNNYKKAKRELLLAHLKIANQRRDFHFKTALRLAREYDVVYLEDLNIKAMQRLWGKKISDLGHGNFVNVLKHQCNKHGSLVFEIDRFYPSSKTCSACGSIKKDLSLRERSWTCGDCGANHDRDFNAAVNILRVGASALAGGVVSPANAG